MASNGCPPLSNLLSAADLAELRTVLPAVSDEARRVDYLQSFITTRTNNQMDLLPEHRLAHATNLLYEIFARGLISIQTESTCLTNLITQYQQQPSVAAAHPQQLHGRSQLPVALHHNAPATVPPVMPTTNDILAFTLMQMQQMQQMHQMQHSITTNWILDMLNRTGGIGTGQAGLPCLQLMGGLGGGSLAIAHGPTASGQQLGSLVSGTTGIGQANTGSSDDSRGVSSSTRRPLSVPRTAPPTHHPLLICASRTAQKGSNNMKSASASSTPKITREEWEASACLAKQKKRLRGEDGSVSNQYSLCPACDQGWKTGANEKPCFGIRCPTLKPNDLTMKEVLDGFQKQADLFSKEEKEVLEGTLDMFCHSIAREWLCMDNRCEYRERPRSAANAYAISHSASEISENMLDFCSYFIVRKTFSSDREKQVICTIMSKLNQYLFERGVITMEQKNEKQGEIDACITVEGDKIMASLSDLKANDYWAKLAAAEEDSDVGDDDGNRYCYVVDNECGLTVAKVEKDGWKLALSDYSGDSFVTPLNFHRVSPRWGERA